VSWYSSPANAEVSLAAPVKRSYTTFPCGVIRAQVPELASRAHLQNIVPVVDAAIKQANIELNDIDAVAFTQAPGLIGSLLVGSQFAKSLALSLNKPLIAVHHMQAHVLSNLIPERRPSFPFLCLTVSGGHTQIVIANSATDLKVIGETLDDAAGGFGASSSAGAGADRLDIHDILRSVVQQQEPVFHLIALGEDLVLTVLGNDRLVEVAFRQT